MEALDVRHTEDHVCAACQRDDWIGNKDVWLDRLRLTRDCDRLRSQGLLPDNAKPGTRLIDLDFRAYGKTLREVALRHPSDKQSGEFLTPDDALGDFVFSCLVDIPAQQFPKIDLSIRGFSIGNYPHVGWGVTDGNTIRTNHHSCRVMPRAHDRLLGSLEWASTRGGMYGRGESVEHYVRARTNWFPREKSGFHWHTSGTSLDPDVQAGQKHLLTILRRGEVLEYHIDNKPCMHSVSSSDGPYRVMVGVNNLHCNVSDISLKVLAPAERPLLKLATGDATQPAVALRVTGLCPGGYGSWLGLKENDLIVSYGGQSPDSLESLARLINLNLAKPSVRLAVLRGGTRLEGEVAPRDLGILFEALRDGFRLYKEGRSAAPQFDAAVKDGYARLETDDCLGAAESFQKAVNNGLADAGVLGDLSLCRARLGQLDKAAEAGEKALVADPGQIDVGQRLVQIMMVNNTPAAADSALKKLRAVMTDKEDLAWAQCMKERLEAMAAGFNLFTSSAAAKDKPPAVRQDFPGRSRMSGNSYDTGGGASIIRMPQGRFKDVAVTVQASIAHKYPSPMQFASVAVAFEGERFLAGFTEEGALIVADPFGVERLWRPVKAAKAPAPNALRVVKQSNRYEVHLNGAKALTWYLAEVPKMETAVLIFWLNGRMQLQELRLDSPLEPASPAKPAPPEVF